MRQISGSRQNLLLDIAEKDAVFHTQSLLILVHKIS